MAKTRLELVNICKRKTKDTSSTSTSGFQEDLASAEAIVSTLLNEGQTDKKLGTLSLTIGVETYALASDVASIEQVILISPTGDAKEIVLVDKETFRSTNAVTSDDSQACPSVYYNSEPVIGSNGVITKEISFFPIPDKSYTVQYSYNKNDSFMSADTSYPFFDGRYHEILCDYAIWQYYERETDESGNPMYWQNKWNQGLQWLIETYPRDNKQLLPIPGPDQYERD